MVYTESIVLDARECKGDPENILTEMRILLDKYIAYASFLPDKTDNLRYIASNLIYNALCHYHNMNWFMKDLQIYDSTMYYFGIKIVRDESLKPGEIRLVYKEDNMPTFDWSLRQLHTITSDTVKIKKVIFNNPATIVYWSDNTKTVVKCSDGDIYDEEKGLAMAICKKMLGLKEFYKQYNKAVDEVNERKVR